VPLVLADSPLGPASPTFSEHGGRFAAFRRGRSGSGFLAACHVEGFSGLHGLPVSAAAADSRGGRQRHEGIISIGQSQD